MSIKVGQDHSALNHWDNFMHYLEDGRLEIDNNRSERVIKPFVIGRKNWLFSGSHHGAIASANLYTLIETAKLHRHNPYDYMRYLFTYLPQAKTLQQLEALLPFNFKWGGGIECLLFGKNGISLCIIGH